MNLKRKIVACALLAVLGVSLLTGCGVGFEKKPNKTPATTAPTTASTTAPTTAPTETTTPTEPTSLAYPNLITYEEYMALSGDEQYAYFLTFPTATDFNNWYNGEKAKWEAKHEKENTDGNITLN